MNSSPANHYRVVVGRPALWPPRTFAVLYNFMGCHCRGRHPRRPAEGSRPLPTNRSKTGLRTKKAHRPQSGAVRKISLCYARLTPAGACRPRPAFPSGLGLGEVLALGGEVGLDLRLSAGGTHDNRRAAFQRVDQDVGSGQAGLLGLLVVHDLDDLVTGKVLRRVDAQVLHDVAILSMPDRPGNSKLSTLFR